MIKGIIFDCFGVLYNGSLQELQRRCPEERRDELRDCNRRADYGFITTDEYVEQVAEIIGISKGEAADILRTMHSRNPDVVAYVKEMRGLYKTAMLSNVGSETIQELFTPEELEGLFDAVVLSYQEHMVKPNPAIFELAAERMGLAPDECIMIDDLMENCDGAEAARLHPVLFTNLENTQQHIAEIVAANA